MKKLIFLLFFHFAIYSQDNNGYVVEYNMPLSVEFQVYEIPLRINKVDSQAQIDYSCINGLLQSYLSASNMVWAKSEYIDENEKIIRDNEHFEAVKKASINDYIQLETTYTFNFQNKKYAFVKYSLVFEKLPFPWTSLMILENKNNRWYISKLINQNQILLFLGNSSNDFIVDCLSQKNRDIETNKIIENSKVNNKISMSKLSLQINSFDEKLKSKFYDKRILDEKFGFRNASLSVTSKTYKFELYHPFLFNTFEIYNYKNENNIIKDDKNSTAYQNRPEFILLTDQPINFLSKIIIDNGDKKYYIIKFKRNNNLFTSIIEGVNNQYSIVENNSLNQMSNIFHKYGSSLIKEFIENPKSEFIGSDGGVNIDEIFDYIEKNKASLSKYLDN
ncbi:hypothetical protein EH230_12110 [Flavobacterium columnare]|uniref:Uncharacterized protein n=1 Tax=Flavobacterium columnare TaxID=996 RepID=A0A437UD87_9FLAO|nr:hypothetical protein [Flavobacterium columnare]RVU91583.1 hypothetical protein EH230_12110 [Flavobacterium columnare]